MGEFVLYNYFEQFKRDMLINIFEIQTSISSPERIDDEMFPWIEKFNRIPNVCTVYCGSGKIDDLEREEWRKLIQEEEDKLGSKVEVEIPELRHPYIAFVMDKVKPIIEWNIEGIKYCPTDMGSEIEDFTVGVRRSHFVRKKFDYFFHFPTEENFDEKMEKVYNKCKEIISD